MRIAVLSDSKGDVSALQEALNDAAKAGADAIWGVGDLLGDAANADETARLLSEARASVAVRHNGHALPLAGEGRAYFENAPSQRVVHVAGRSALLCSEPLDSEEKSRTISAQYGSDLIVCSGGVPGEYRETSPAAIIHAGSLAETGAYVLVDLTSDGLSVSTRHLAVKEDVLNEEDAVLRLAELCRYEEEHSQQVARLADLLFQQTSELHDLGEQEQEQLRIAAILHDIGWIDGKKGHHKRSLKIILASAILPFDSRLRLIIGSIARYHRRATPKKKHDHFAALQADDQEIVRKLSAILRVADALDYSHGSLVRSLETEIQSDAVVLKVQALGDEQGELESLARKSNLFVKTFGRQLVVRWNSEQ
ncbi:MAG: HD domain-containing protein [Armatimonadetes bacterium]|nr:HD domain-containing protein [Armatimonadota bacterium]